MRLNIDLVGLSVGSEVSDTVHACFLTHIIEEEATTMKISNQSSIKPETKTTGQESVLWHDWHMAESPWKVLNISEIR